jgi:hypothetical protein
MWDVAGLQALDELRPVFDELLEDVIDAADQQVRSDALLSAGIAPSQAHSGQLSDKIRGLCETIAGVLDDLVLLGPSLDHPHPQDLDTILSPLGGSGGSPDVELAKCLFPHASQTLQLRLGRLNWRRRAALTATHDERNEIARARRLKSSTRREIAVDAFNFQKPTLGAHQTEARKQPLRTVATTASKPPSEIVSEIGSIFSRPSLIHTFTTESILASITSAKPSEAPPAVIQCPKMPVQLRNLLDGESRHFICMFCGFDLAAGLDIKTEQDWKKHVFQDLEPYLCTFDDCLAPQRTYTLKEEWFKHELGAHRIEKVWTCTDCFVEFPSRDSAEQHLETAHDTELDDEEVLMMKELLRPSLSRKPLGPKLCPLCRHTLPFNETEDHIANHLEAFSLLVIDQEDSENEDDEDEVFSLTNDDMLSEIGRKVKILDAFVREQLNLELERQPPDNNLLENDFELLDDVSVYTSSEDNGFQPGSGRRGQTTNLIERMLDHDQQGGTKAGSLSLTSSAERLPLLRTCPYPRNEDFTGRDRDLANLYKILSEPGRVCVVSGEGGMGKTALAVEFSWRFERCYHYIFWIQAETPVGSSDTFCQIAIQLGLVPEGTNEGVDIENAIRLGREFLENVRDKRWLLIFDNVDLWDDIDIYHPTKSSATHGSILITTRNETLTAPSRPVNYYRMALQEFDVEEGRKLLIHGLPQDLRPRESSLRDPNYKIAGEIARLAGLPLLIIYISGYIKWSGCTISQFWEFWEDWRPNRLADEATGRDSIFYIALRDLPSEARKILGIMAFLGSDGIQKELLVWQDNNKLGPSYLRAARLVVLLSSHMRITNLPDFEL